MSQEKEALEGYEFMYALLRREQQRAAASSAMRLLDDVLQVCIKCTLSMCRLIA